MEDFFLKQGIDGVEKENKRVKKKERKKERRELGKNIGSEV